MVSKIQNKPFSVYIELACFVWQNFQVPFKEDWHSPNSAIESTVTSINSDSSIISSATEADYENKIASNLLLTYSSTQQHLYVTKSKKDSEIKMSKIQEKV